MTERLHDILASYADAYSVDERLHAVPPYEVHSVTVDGVQAVCKLDAHPEGDAAIEGCVQQYVGRETGVPVPEVLAVGPDYYLVAHDDAVPDPDAETDLRAWARPAGVGLATLHAETTRERSGLPAVGDGCLTSEAHDVWTDTALAFLRHRRRYLATVGHADVADIALEFFERHPGLLRTDVAPVLCHGNWLPDHVGVDSDVTAVIDFEHALFAPPAYDYWRVALPLFQDDEVTRRRFRAGYESVRPLSTGRREAYVLLNSVSYLRSLYLQDQHGPEATERKAAYFRDAVVETVERLRAETD